MREVSSRWGKYTALISKKWDALARVSRCTSPDQHNRNTLSRLVALVLPNQLLDHGRSDGHPTRRCAHHSPPVVQSQTYLTTRKTYACLNQADKATHGKAPLLLQV